MTPEQERELQTLTEKVDKLESILLGISNDPRLQSYIRDTVIDGITSAGLPIIKNKNGTRWSITNVTKLN